MAIQVSSIEHAEPTVRASSWTPKKVIATIAGVAALLGAGGGGVYGLEATAGGAQKELDKAQDARIVKCEKAIEMIYGQVVENGKGIAVLLERTKDE